MSKLPRNAKKGNKHPSKAPSTKPKAGSVIQGSSTEGKTYQSIDDLWRSVVPPASATTPEEGATQEALYKEDGWYGRSLNYWKKVSPTINGVLGGMEHIHDQDIRESKAFITSLKERGTGRALDCGAGIGRITRHLLVDLYNTVDLLEPVETMMEQAKTELKEEAGKGKVGHFYLTSMEKHVPEEKYDLVVIQWAAIYLTDDDFVKVFKQYKESLTENGYLFFKENCSSSDSFLVDDDDSSLTRSDKHYKLLFDRAGVKVVKETFQKDWPHNLMKVKMYALR